MEPPLRSEGEGRAADGGETERQLLLSAISSSPHNDRKGSLPLEDDDKENAGKRRCLEGWKNHFCSRRGLQALVWGQMLSVCIAITGATSQELQTLGISTPTTQTFFNYLLLCVYFFALAARQKKQMRSYDSSSEFESSLTEVSRPPFWGELWKRSWKYAVLALIDVEANFLVVKSFEFTTYAMVTLLDCFSTPSVVLLSYFILKTRYRPIHVIGAAVCLGGIAMLVATELAFFNGSDNSTIGEGSSVTSSIAGKNPALGCTLCLIGAFLYAISNVGQEKMIVAYHRYEYLAFLGFYASIISGVQIIITERDALASVVISLEAVLLYAGFALAMFSLYSITPIVLDLAGAAFLNISLLTSDFLAVIVSIFLFNYVPSALYYVAFVGTAGGIVLYNIQPAQRKPT